MRGVREADSGAERRSRTSVRVATCEYWRCGNPSIPSSRTSVRVATPTLLRDGHQRRAFKPHKRAGCNGKATQLMWLMHGLLCAYLNLFECITRSAKQSLTITISILGREVAPYGAKRAGHLCLLGLRTHILFDQRINVLDRNILRGIIIRIRFESAFRTNELCLGLPIVVINMPAPTASL